MEAPLDLSTHQNLLISGESVPDLRGLQVDCLSDVVCSWEIVFKPFLFIVWLQKHDTALKLTPEFG